MMITLLPSKRRPARPNVTESGVTLLVSDAGAYLPAHVQPVLIALFKAHCLQELRDCLTELADKEKGVAS
jgi:hypothetical protein